MNITNQMIELISDIEYKIGCYCYNGNSYNGWTKEYGCSFRYPIYYRTMIGDKAVETHTRANIKNRDITPENLRTVFYKFGSNHLMIGIAVIDVLNILETRYGIDFNAMEETYQAERIKR